MYYKIYNIKLLTIFKEIKNLVLLNKNKKYKISINNNYLYYFIYIKILSFAIILILIIIWVKLINLLYFTIFNKTKIKMKL